MGTRCIYKIINVKNGKFYVGSAVHFSRRKARHKWKLKRGDHSNKHLQAAWDKYGERAFVFAIVQEVGPDEDLLEMENRWLHEHVGKDYCYNIAKDATAIGLGKSGELNPMYGRRFNHTEDAKVRIGAAAKGRPMTESAKRKISATLKGHVVPVETREKISNTLKGEGNYWYGKARPEFAEMVRKPIYCPTNGVTYSSIKQLREELGLNPPTINRALKSGKPIAKGKYAGWSFQYAEKEDATR